MFGSEDKYTFYTITLMGEASSPLKITFFQKKSFLTFFRLNSYDETWMRKTGHSSDFIYQDVQAYFGNVTFSNTE